MGRPGNGGGQKGIGDDRMSDEHGNGNGMHAGAPGGGAGAPGGGAGAPGGLPNTIVRLTVRNHPGAMSHITGLFSRRGFNLEGILCAPVDGADSAMYLLVKNDERLEQIVKQLAKLYDVKAVAVQDDLDHTVFNRIEELLSEAQTMS